MSVPFTAELLAQQRRMFGHRSESAIEFITPHRTNSSRNHHRLPTTERSASVGGSASFWNSNDGSNTTTTRTTGYAKQSPETNDSMAKNDPKPKGPKGSGIGRRTAVAVTMTTTTTTKKHSTSRGSESFQSKLAAAAARKQKDAAVIAMESGEREEETDEDLWRGLIRDHVERDERNQGQSDRAHQAAKRLAQSHLDHLLHNFRQGNLKAADVRRVCLTFVVSLTVLAMVVFAFKLLWTG